MITRHKTSIGIMALGAFSLALGLGTADEAQGGDTALAWARTASIKGLETDAAGTIITIEYVSNNVNKTVNGCGAKITALPQLVEYVTARKTVDIGHQGNCLKKINVK